MTHSTITARTQLDFITIHVQVTDYSSFHYETIWVVWVRCSRASLDQPKLSENVEVSACQNVTTETLN
jgi:hypothetical protein